MDLDDVAAIVAEKVRQSGLVRLADVRIDTTDSLAKDKLCLPK
jgi:hypothetical protein